MAETGGQQRPFEYGSLTEDLFFKPALGGPVAPPPRVNEVERAWAAMKDSGSIAALQAFRRQYGAANPIYDQLAEARIDGLKVALLQQEEKRRKPAEEVDMKPGRVFRDCAECPEMVVVPAGSFMMGTPASEERRDQNERPQHRVTFARPFAVGKFEVTFAEWDACVAAGGCSHRPGDKGPSDKGWGRGRRPVIDVSWENITMEYLPWLSRKAGKTYRLMSEAEWEYAARAGTTTSFSTGGTITTEQANFDGRRDGGVYREETVQVGSFPPNAFGLHDMHGNVWEWVQDCWNQNYSGAPGDGSAWTTGDCSRRVIRGGAWHLSPALLRSADRLKYPAHARWFYGGFRVGRTL
jgi:formylglycine-generating enzyme required for sulfatase activity